MDLIDFYFSNFTEMEYHYRFYDFIRNKSHFYDPIDDDYYSYDFKVLDVEEAITQFRRLCQPDIKEYDNEKKCWFYLVTYYLDKVGYEIKEYPRLLARPPIDPSEFAYTQIRDRIIAEGHDENGIVRYTTRRNYVSSLTFVQRSDHIELIDAIEQKFIEISNRHSPFDEMDIDEKLAEIANLIESFLKKDGKFATLDYSTVCFDFLNNEMIIAYRKKMQCFRHSTDEAIDERRKISGEQKNFLVDYGLTIVKAIHALVSR